MNEFKPGKRISAEHLNRLQADAVKSQMASYQGVDSEVSGGVVSVNTIPKLNGFWAMIDGKTTGTINGLFAYTWIEVKPKRPEEDAGFKDYGFIAEVGLRCESGTWLGDDETQRFPDVPQFHYARELNNHPSVPFGSYVWMQPIWVDYGSYSVVDGQVVNAPDQYILIYVFQYHPRIELVQVIAETGTTGYLGLAKYSGNLLRYYPAGFDGSGNVDPDGTNDSFAYQGDEIVIIDINSVPLND